MHRDDISALYLQLGLPSQHYQDFRTEEEFRSRIGKIAAVRAAARTAARIAVRKHKIVTVVSVGDFPSKHFVGALAQASAQRLGGREPVQAVDLAPAVDGQSGHASFGNGVSSILIDASTQVVRVEVKKDAAWLERQVDTLREGGVVFLDVPERVLHVRSQAMAMADLVLAVLPANMAAGRVVEDVEAGLNEIGRSGARAVSYVLVEASDAKGFSAQLCNELMAGSELFAPAMIGKELMAEWSGGSSPSHRSLADLCDHVFGRLPA